jgi:hypothetical protein
MTHSSTPPSASEANGNSDLFEAQRTAQGWSTVRRLSPSGTQAVTPNIGGAASDHLYAFTRIEPKGEGHPAGTLGDEGYASYLSAPDGSFEPIGIGSLGVELFAQGRYISEGGRHVIFSTGSDPMQSVPCASTAGGCDVLRLEPNAPPTGTGAVYDREADGKTRVVSLLPNDQPPEDGEEAFYEGSSKAGTVVAFTVEGTLYVRIENQVTLKVAEGGPTYAGLSADGRYAFYVAGGESGDIHRFDTTDSADDQINATGDAEVVNVSADGSHVYLISKSQIGGQGVSGQPNLYVWSGGSPEYIATVAASDLVRTSGSLGGTPALTNWTDWAVAPLGLPPGFDAGEEIGPGGDSSRTSTDGSVLVFESRAPLGGADNAGHTEIYRYDDNDKSLACVSCSALAPATADARLQELKLVPAGIVLNNLTDDGNRVFFETAEALVPRDTDGVNDIYEWRKEGGDPPVLDLISSGKSTQYLPPPEQAAYAELLPNVLYALSFEGEDVIFATQDPLLPEAGVGGVPAIYDARVDGGFPSPAVPSICLEEECRPAGSGASPSLLTPPSVKSGSKGNVKRHRRRCHSRRHGHRAKAARRCSRHRHKRNRARRPSAAASASPMTQSIDPQEQVPATMTTTSDPATGPARTSVTGSIDKFDEFGIKAVGAEASTNVAGAHPDFTTILELNSYLNRSMGSRESDARTKQISVSLPPGLIGNINAVPRCSTGALFAFANCPVESQVGITRILPTGFREELTEPVYNLEPTHPDEEVARFGFYAYLYPVFIDVKVRTASDYGVTATVHSAPAQTSLLKAKTTFWGNPADPSHDELRLTAGEAWECPTACRALPGGKRSSGLTEPFAAFMTNPSACQSGEVDFEAESYQLPGRVFTAPAPLDPVTDCTGLPFAPSFEAKPTSHVPGAPTGLQTKLIIPQHLGPEERATATMREARVTLPAGMQIAAGAANWIGTCSDRQVGYHQEVDAACPDASKLGTATIKSPALPVPLEGSLYQRNPSPGHQFGLWLVTDQLGLHVKLPGELEPDPQSGRLSAVFKDLPQVPVEEIDLNIWGGSRAPLENPDACGTYTTAYSFAPHSQDPAVSGQSQMAIDQGCNRGFDPKLEAGVTKPVAGSFSPLIVDLTRDDGQQNLRGFEITLPDGELAKLKGVPLCSDPAAQSGSCPADSAIGHLAALTGPGSDPLWIPQPGKVEPRVYLAGPYEGSPFSIVTVAPAQAGPFDLGNVIVRSGLGLDPDTNRAVVKADPLPQFFEGVGLVYRRLHVVVDRPGFSLNPTDCRVMHVNSTVSSTQGAVAHPASRFQVDGCKRLKFNPRLKLALRGGTERGDYPALTATLKARKGDANIAQTTVALPHSEFLAQEHIGTICTRKQFAVDECPKGSVYGKAKAWTPLLAKPLEGPVYLRSSNHPLPDLVAALGGELDVNLAGRIDSTKSGGIRTSFESVPDAPITKFVLKMKGGKKSLLVNSVDTCLREHRALVKMGAQNGRARSSKQVLTVKGCGKVKR